MVMRIGFLAVVAVAACTPDVPGGVYFCGPEQSCPPDLSCDQVTAVCVYPEEAEPFECGENSNLAEPDDTLVLADDLGQRGCGFETVVLDGCIDHEDDVDHIGMVSSLDCDVRPFEAKVRFSIAFAPAVLELLDDAGEVIATSEICNELDDSGQVQACIETSVPEDTQVYLRIRLLDDAPDCGGRCRYNRYQLSIQ